jgi:hypothetical protein
MSDSDRDASASPIRGRPFAAGNAGRPPGAKNKTTQLAAGLLAEAAPDIIRVGLEKAKAGDLAMQKLFVPLILPKRRVVELELPPLHGTADAVATLAAITDAAANGQITPDEGAALAVVVEAYVRAINVQDLEARVQTIEKRLSES